MARNEPATRVASAGDAVRVERLTVRHRKGARPALDGVSFVVPRGVIAGVVGPDGAGKTTLLRCLAGLTLQTSGEVAILGLRWTEHRSALQQRVAYMPQTGNVYDNLTVRENLELFAELYGVPLAEKRARLEQLLEASNLAAFQRRLARALSGGMRQKLGLICCLVSEPDLLVLDEPGVGVDVVSRRELWNIYRDRAAAGTTVLLSTTYMDEADECDYVIVLDEGRLVYAAPPDEFRARAGGRVAVCHASQLPPRHLAARLADTPGLLDAIVEGDQVRVLLTDELARLRSSLAQVCPHVDQAAPRFSDAFVLAIGAKSTSESTTRLPAFIQERRAPSHEDHQEMVVVERVTKQFGRFVAVREVSFRAYRGEVFGLLGANGAGKTTLFRMLCGVLQPTRGRLLVAGADATRAPIALRQRIGYMAQRFALYRELTVAENISFYGRAYNVDGRALNRRIEQLLDSLGLRPLARTRSDELPLGFKQRLSLACAIVHDPEIVFLDEPTSGVDPLARREFWRLMNALAALGRTVLVTTHFMEEAEYCDRVVIMEAGRVIAQGSPAEILGRAWAIDSTARTFEDAFVILLQQHRVRQDSGSAPDHPRL